MPVRKTSRKAAPRKAAPRKTTRKPASRKPATRRVSRGPGWFWIELDGGRRILVPVQDLADRASYGDVAAFYPASSKMQQVMDSGYDVDLTMNGCPSCGGVSHPASGSVLPSGEVVCGPCVRRFWSWASEHGKKTYRVGKKGKGSKYIAFPTGITKR